MHHGNSPLISQMKTLYDLDNVNLIIKVYVNTLRPSNNGRHFADEIFKCIFLNENVWIPIKISLKFVSKGPINYILALVQIMAWRRPGDKPLSEPMMVKLLTHICVTRSQWVKTIDDIDLINPYPNLISRQWWLIFFWKATINNTRVSM